MITSTLQQYTDRCYRSLECGVDTADRQRMVDEPITGVRRYHTGRLPGQVRVSRTGHGFIWFLGQVWQVSFTLITVPGRPAVCTYSCGVVLARFGDILLTFVLWRFGIDCTEHIQEGLVVASIARDDPSTLPGDNPFPLARMHGDRNAR